MKERGRGSIPERAFFESCETLLLLCFGWVRIPAGLPGEKAEILGDDSSGQSHPPEVSLFLLCAGSILLPLAWRVPPHVRAEVNRGRESDFL